MTETDEEKKDTDGGEIAEPGGASVGDSLVPVGRKSAQAMKTWKEYQEQLKNVSGDARAKFQKVADMLEMIAASEIMKEIQADLRVLAKESLDAARAFTLGTVFGEAARPEVEKMGGTTQLPERQAFEFALQTRALVLPWMIRQVGIGAALGKALLDILIRP